MYKGEIINQLLRQRGMMKKDLLEKLGWKSQSQLKQVMFGNPTVQTLELVADALSVPIGIFFDQELKEGESSIFNESITVLEERVIQQDRLLEERERHIENLEKTINILTKGYK